MQLRKRAFGFAMGLFWGLTILFLTWWLLIWGSPGEIVSKLASFFIGYSFSWGGGVIGFIWGFVYGFVGGVIFAWFYDFFYKMLYKEK